jgi:integrase/recombinase XerD
MKAEIYYLIKHMKYCRYSDNTIKMYVHYVQLFLDYFNTDPKHITEDQIRAFMFQSVFEEKRSYSSQNIMINALKMFYLYVVKRTINEEIFIRPRKNRYLPEVLSKEEIQAIIKSIKNLKHRTLISTIYSCGLRISEVINLTLRDIDSSRMIVYIRQSKGRKDRIIPLSQKLLSQLREYWREYKPNYYLFEGVANNPYSSNSISNILENAVFRCKINKKVTVHTLRHSYATHLMEAGVNLRFIQAILGHSNIKTTEIYTHVSKVNLKDVYSPFDELVQ